MNRICQLKKILYEIMKIKRFVELINNFNKIILLICIDVVDIVVVKTVLNELN